jgi:hypothetical protein
MQFRLQLKKPSEKSLTDTVTGQNHNFYSKKVWEMQNSSGVFKSNFDYYQREAH